MPQRSAPLSIAGIVLLAVAAEGLLTLMDAIIKQLSPRYPTLQIAFLRFAFGMVGAVAYALWTRPGRPTRDATLYNGLRAGLVVLTATSFFFALSLLPLADAIALSFISPVLTALMGTLILGERLDWRIAVALEMGPADRAVLLLGGAPEEAVLHHRAQGVVTEVRASGEEGAEEGAPRPHRLGRAQAPQQAPPLGERPRG
jgi:uncharacterized membrane protein